MTNPRERSHIEEPIPVERQDFPVNRWAAFTDDELQAIRYHLSTVSIYASALALSAEAAAELERRKT